MSSGEAFCCCEYENSQGERSHILACCCDCQALDEMADRCFKCQKIPTSLVDKFIDNVLDRLRLPSLTGGGAIRVNLEVATPIVVIPVALTIATIGKITTCVVLSVLPYFCFFFYRTWKRRNKKSRTKFFYVWGVMSVIYMYIIFEFILCQHATVSNTDNFVISISVILMFIALYCAKKNPGIILSQTNLSMEDLEKPDNSLQYKHILGSNQSWELNSSLRSEMKSGDSDETVVQLYSQDVDKAGDENYCDKCKLQRPLRAGHCTVCNVCIRQRDHHCVWIDSCIGEDNHRAFLVAMAMFVFVGYYGSYVTIETVFGPSPGSKVYDLRVAYRDFKFALCFVGACYVALVTTIMAVGVVNQVILISQNITSQELHRAAVKGQTKCFLLATHKPFDRGILKNWSLFFQNKRAN